MKQKESTRLSDYQRIVSYLYEYHHGIKGSNVGFAKIEKRQNRLRTVEKETDLTASELTEQPEVRQKIIRAYVYEREFRRIKALPDFKKLLAWLNENQINLRQFKHKISIVFQNARDGELNLLFTGDAQPEHLKMIAENYDGKLPLYEHYWCIKVPHHGTQGHYFDFSQYEPENMLISNGIHFANSKKESKELRTSPLYGGLFYIPDTHMYCSNCDCCDSYENGCSCTRIYKAVYFARIRLP